MELLRFSGRGRPDDPGGARLAAFSLSAAVFGIALATAAPISAVVNTEALRVGADEAGWSGFFKLTLAAVQGNSDALLAGAGFRVQHAILDEHSPPGVESEPVEYTRQRVFLVANYSFAEQNDERSVNQGFGHLRWTGMRTYRRGYETFLQFETDEFTRLDRRSLTGFGLRWAPVRTEKGEVFLGTGYMFEDEHRDVPREGPDERRTRHHRWSSYLTLKWESADARFLMVNTLYVQPRFDELDDFRVLEEAAFEVEINDEIALGLSLQLSHDNLPPAGVEETDITLANTIRIGF